MQPLLPKLKDGDGNRVANFDQVGVWDARPAIELDRLSESLMTGDGDPKYFEIDSIPDMWARPLLFETAFADAGHPLHTRVIGEWRGIIAALALKELRRLPIAVAPVAIPENTEQEQGSEDSVSGFLSALAKTVPKKSLSPDTLWRDLYVVLFKGVPFGMTSPTTLLCTAGDCYNRIQGVSWFDGRFLVDPVSPDMRLNEKERQALGGWIEQLRGNLNGHPGLDHQQYNTLVKRLTEYQEALRLTDVVSIQLSESGFGMEKGIFRYLDRPVQGFEGDPRESAVRLLASDGRAPDRYLLVIDRAIAQQWQLQEHEVLVFGSLSLSSVPYEGMRGDPRRIGEMNLPNAEWRTPSMFFTEKLYVIRSSFPGTLPVRGQDGLLYGNESVKPILPIQSELLAYIDDLDRRTSFEMANDGILVRLRLPLRGLDGQGRDFEISKLFRFSENEVEALADVQAILEVWPNFRAPGWNRYYVYYAPEDETTAVFYATPYTPGEESESRMFCDPGGGIRREIRQLKAFPEAIICTLPSALTQTNTPRGLAAGVLLLKRPPLLPRPAKSWSVGVDFGTTNTNVFVSDGVTQPSALQFQPRFLTVTMPGETRRTYMDKFFLLGTETRAPFQSVFHRFEWKDQTLLQPLIDGHIYYFREHTGFDAGEPGMNTDLKWGDTNDRKCVHAFLEQLCLQISAEAVANQIKEISWRYSFPTAFPLEHREDFRVIWNQVARSCEDATGCVAVAEPWDNTESIVAAHFFADHLKAPFHTGTVCIDIGGGTSDISVWQNNTLCWETSLRFAGRDIFLDPIRQNPDLLAAFGMAAADLERLRNLRGHRSAFYAQIDALVGYDGSRWLRELPTHAGNPGVQRLIQVIAIGMAGLLYYVGLLLRHLSQKGTYQPVMPDIYVAGNGSRLFHWLAKGMYGTRSEVNRLFRGILAEASELRLENRTFELTISPSPKAEAAYGLVSQGSNDGTPLRYETRRTNDEVVSGEVFVTDERELDWDALLNAKLFSDGLRTPPKLVQLERFVEVFDRFASSNEGSVMPILPNRRLIDRVGKGLAQYLGNLEGKEPSSIKVEPLFISALRCLAEAKVNESSEA